MGSVRRMLTRDIAYDTHRRRRQTVVVSARPVVSRCLPHAIASEGLREASHRYRSVTISCGQIPKTRSADSMGVAKEDRPKVALRIVTIHNGSAPKFAPRRRNHQGVIAARLATDHIGSSDPNKPRRPQVVEITLAPSWVPPMVGPRVGKRGPGMASLPRNENERERGPAVHASRNWQTIGFIRPHQVTITSHLTDHHPAPFFLLRLRRAPALLRGAASPPGTSSRSANVACR